MLHFARGGWRQAWTDGRTSTCIAQQTSSPVPCPSSFVPRLFTVLALVLLVLIFIRPAAAHDADPFVVTNTADSGVGSLRQAIIWANEHPGLDRIDFAIPGPGPHRIVILTPLPNISDPLHIRGATQPGADCSQWPPTLKIQLDGENRANSGDALRIYADNSVIEGLVISRFGFGGIAIMASHVTVRCNFIGTDPTGVVDMGNGNDAVWIWGPTSGQGSHNVIGVDSAGQGIGNLLSGNGVSGVGITGQYADDNLVAGNFIGVDQSGMQAMSNGNAGVRLTYGADRTQIGGLLSEMRNVISANTPGVDLDQVATTQIIGNFIGVNAAGSAAIPNMHFGVHLNNFNPDTTIKNNLISGNSGMGVLIAGGPRPIVQGNIIGADASGTLPIGNSDHGIYALVSPDGLFGGPNLGEGNLIAFNGGNGILVGEIPGRNRITGNRIFANELLGIDLGWLSPTGVVTPNDPGDSDTGQNDLQNFPVIDHAFQVGDDLTLVQGMLNSHANEPYRLEFFANSQCDLSGYGEGERYRGALDVTTDGSGNAAFTTVLEAPVPEGALLTATATDADGNTSEFSACRRVEGAPPSLAGIPIPLPDAGATLEDTPVIIDVLANDRDLDGSPLSVVSVSASPNGAASVVGSQIVITPAANFNGVLLFLYGVSDGDPNHDVVQSSVRVQVTPVNDAPSDIGLSSTGVSENLPPDSVVGDLLAADADVGDNHTFYLVGGADNDAFRLNGRQLRTRRPFDFETKNHYVVHVRAVDSAGAALEKEIGVAVFDGNDAPTAITLSGNYVLENEPAGALVGALSSSDPDAGDLHAYALVGGVGSDDNAFFVVEGATLRTAASFDYEARHQRAIRIRSTDNTGASFERAFLIVVGDQPSPPDTVEELPLYCRGGAVTLIENHDSDPKKRVQVRIDNVAVSNVGPAGCTLKGSLSIFTNGNAVTNLAVSANVNERNEFTSTTIENFKVVIAGVTFQMQQATIQQYAGRPQISIGKVKLQMPEQWGKQEIGIPNPVLIDSGGVHITGGNFKLPSIKTVGGYGLSLEGSLIFGETGYEIAADGELTIPNIGKSGSSPGQSCGLSAGVTIFVDAQGNTALRIDAAAEPQSFVMTDAMQLRRITLGFRCSTGIPIAGTGLFLTAVKGTVRLAPDKESVEMEVTIVTDQKTVDQKPVAVMNGAMSVDIKPSFRLDLGVSLQIVAIGLVQTNATVTKQSFSATVRVEASFIKGQASISAWSTDNNRRWHFTGSLAASVYLKKGIFGERCVDLPCVTKWCAGGWYTFGQQIPCGMGTCKKCLTLPKNDVGPLATGGMQFGEFANQRYGIKGYFEVLNQTIGFYMDEDGQVSFGDMSSYQLVQGPALAACGWPVVAQGEISVAAGAAIPLKDEQGQPGGVLIPAPLVKGSAQPLNGALSVRAADVISKVNLVRHSDVAFILESSAPLGLSVIDPSGFEITAANYQDHPRYAIQYEQTQSFEPERAAQNVSGWAQLRFTHAAPDASLTVVDVIVDGALLFAGVDFRLSTPSNPLPVAAGVHTIEIGAPGGAPLLAQTVNLAADGKYSVVLVGNTPTNAAPALLVLADDDSPPSAAGAARVRLVNGSGQPLTLLLDGAPLFNDVAYQTATNYVQITAGNHSVELRHGANVVGPAQALSFDEGDLYTIFTADSLADGHPVQQLQRLDQAYRLEIHSEFAVDQADPGDWLVKLTGDVVNTPYLLAVLGPSSPPVLGSLSVDATNLPAAVVGWRLTADYAPVKLKFFVTPDPITRTLTVSGDGGGDLQVIVPAFEGFAVDEIVLSNPSDLSGAPATRSIDLSRLESGLYHLWVQADDGVNPPVSGYAAAPAALAAGVDQGYGVQAVRIAQSGYDALAQLASAAPILVDHSGDFPSAWDARIRPALDMATRSLSVEWDALKHPDVDSYLLVVDALGARLVISAGGATMNVDANGVPVGDPIGFAVFADVEPGHTYTLTVIGEDEDGGRNAQSTPLVFHAPVGDFRINTPSGLYVTERGGAMQIPLSLAVVDPLLYPHVGLTIDLAQAAVGMDASFVGDAEGVTTLSAANPAAMLAVEIGPSVEDGTYRIRVIGRNGDIIRAVDVMVAVGRVDQFLPIILREPPLPEIDAYLPMVTR